jgi:hypothetical protein
MIFRTEEQKHDLIRSWHRPDRPFFATGACHVLAAAFLEVYPNTGFHPFLILPGSGLRGSHVFVSDGKTVFDYHGFSGHDRFLSHYFVKVRRFFPRWFGEVIRLEESPIGVAFCGRYSHRLPSQYPYDPLPRAFSYLVRFSSIKIPQKSCSSA